MNNSEPVFSTSYLAPPYGIDFIPPSEQRKAAAAVSREAGKEEMARQRALGRPRVPEIELPPIKTPALSDDLTVKVVALDRKIFQRGLALDRDKLVSLGKRRFADLLAAARKCREPREIRAQDLSSFAQVQMALDAFEATTIKPRSTIEQLHGRGMERGAARLIRGWADLWKAADTDAVRRAYFYHDLFTALCFGQSMRERLSPDGRLRSHLLCGGRGPKVELLRQWLVVVTGPLVCVTLGRPLVKLFAWLSDEKAEPPKPMDLAQEWSSLRVPSKTQVRQAEAILDGYLLGYSDWPLWEFVGRATRSTPDRGRLAAQSKELAKALPRITNWQNEIRTAFYRNVGFGFDSHLEFEAGRYRTFLERLSQNLLDQAAALLALGIAQTATVAARFQDRVFVEAGQELKPEIGSLLQAGFPGANFQAGLAEVQHE